MMSFSVLQITLASILLLMFVVQMFYYLNFYSGILYHKHKIKKGKVTFETGKPPVSVIICSKNESENLQNFLPGILNQDYPDYEVVVVNDGSTDESEIVLSALSKQHKNLYHTYLPEEAKFISTKKMALTVGIKAAKNDILLLTDADCTPKSKDWISNIVKNFDDKTELVLSYGAYYQQKGFIGNLISFDTFFIALQYMGFALSGYPYMGVGRNLAYRKSLFFKNKGFASHLHLQSGDDDLFVSEVASKENTKVEISSESITYSIPKVTFKSWYFQKTRHLSTSPFYRIIPKMLIGGEVLSRFLFYLSFIFICLTGQVQLCVFAASTFLIRFIVQALVINLTAKQMNEKKFYSSIILFDMLLPLINLIIMIVGGHKRRSSIKWE